MTRKRTISLLLAVVMIAVLAVLARPTMHLLKAMSRDVDEREPLPTGYIDDASRLNAVSVAQTWSMPVDHDDPEGQLRAMLARARNEQLRVSIAGARHSMGGHTIYPGGIVLDMSPWNHMRLDESHDLLAVGAGAIWKDVIAYLDQAERSVAVMQSNNSFSVGGSISVNCHGWQFGHPPIASTVESFRLMLADGSVVGCSRDENQELFSLVLGGYGLFGVILDVDLRVVPNERYRLEQFIVPVDQALAAYDEHVRDRPDVQLTYARMNTSKQALMSEIIINVFTRESEGAIPALGDQAGESLRRAVFRGSAESDYGKSLRWAAETKLQPLLSGKVFSRNQLLNEGVEVFENRTAGTTDILHEYFVPREQVAGFVDAMRGIVTQRDANLLNVTIRHIDEDTDTFLRYADQELFAFVLLFVQDRDEAGERDMEAMTRELIDAALGHGGRYYLPYRLHATREQFHSAYPQAEAFFARKLEFDPEALFQNQFYLKYGQYHDDQSGQ